VLSVDEKKVLFASECKGDLTELEWGKKITMIALNDKCERALNYGQGGFHEGCGKFILVYGMLEEYFDKLSYDAKEGIIRFSGRKGNGSLDVKHNTAISTNGHVTKLNEEAGSPLQIMYIGGCT
jgi:hypothetical protein